MKSIGGGRDYPGGHTGSLYNGVNNNSKNTNSSNRNGDKGNGCSINSFGVMTCPKDTKCPEGFTDVTPNSSFGTLCVPDILTGKGVSSGDSYGGYNSKGYPVGSGSCGGHGYSVYYDDDEDRYEYKGEYGLLGRLDAEGVTGHGYTPRTEEAHAYDNYDNLVKIPVSPKRMAVWVNDLKTNPGRFQTTFYDKTMWSRPSYDPYMKRI